MTAPHGRLDADVAVVGAGLAGLVCARELAKGGQRVVLLDKGRRPGGRCATRALGSGTVDHGAQFFTVRGTAFAAALDTWRGDGLQVRTWAHGFARAGHVDDGPGGCSLAEDGHPRYAVGGGMRALAEHLARGLDVRRGVRVTGVTTAAGRWLLTDGDGGLVRAASLVVTAPAPQARALLHAGGVPLPARAAARLDGLVFQPCWALLVLLDRPPAVPAPGGVQIDEGPVRWLAENQVKGVSQRPALTVHAREEWSADHLHDHHGEIEDTLGTHLAPWLGRALPLRTHVHRWRYATPVDTRGGNATAADDALAVDVDGSALVLAGDAFAGGKVEGAVRSGLAAARALTG